MIDGAITELTTVVGVKAACQAVGRPRASHYRAHRKSPSPQRPARAPRPQPRALSALEQEQVLEVLHSERFVDLSPAEVHAVLLDEGRYLCSEATMYRLLRARHGKVYEAAGFVLVEQNDGSGNEEREPGCTYTWTPGNPLASRGAGTRGVRPIADRLPADRRAVRTVSGRCTMRIMSDAVVRHSRRHRLEVRVSPEQDALIRHAADLEDITVTAFVLDTVTAHATTVIAQRRDLVLSNPAFDRFIAELDKPPAAVPQLSDLFRRHPKLPEA